MKFAITGATLALLLTAATATFHHRCFIFQSNTASSLTIENHSKTTANALVYLVSRDAPNVPSLDYDLTDLLQPEEEYSRNVDPDPALIRHGYIKVCSAESKSQGDCTGPEGSLYHIYGEQFTSSYTLNPDQEITKDLNGLPSDIIRVCAMVYQPEETSKTNIHFTETHPHGHLRLVEFERLHWRFWEIGIAVFALYWYYKHAQYDHGQPFFSPEAHTLVGFAYVVIATATIVLDSVKVLMNLKHNWYSGGVSPLARVFAYEYVCVLDYFWLVIVCAAAFITNERVSGGEKVIKQYSLSMAALIVGSLCFLPYFALYLNHSYHEESMATVNPIQTSGMVSSFRSTIIGAGIAALFAQLGVSLDVFPQDPALKHRGDTQLNQCGKRTMIALFVLFGIHTIGRLGDFAYLAMITQANDNQNMLPWVRDVQDYGLVGEALLGPWLVESPWAYLCTVLFRYHVWALPLTFAILYDVSKLQSEWIRGIELQESPVCC